MPRIAPSHLEKLADARFDLMAILRREISEQQILEECLEECLGPWLERKLAAIREPAKAEQPAPKRRRSEPTE
jgi:hypothetical protein